MNTETVGVRTRIYPLHAIGKGLVGDEVVSSPSRIGDDAVCRDDSGEDHGEQC